MVGTSVGRSVGRRSIGLCVLCLSACLFIRLDVHLSNSDHLTCSAVIHFFIPSDQLPFELSSKGVIELCTFTHIHVHIPVPRCVCIPGL